MKKTITIKPEHFDAAVKQPWNTQTCILAQAGLDQGYITKDTKFDPEPAICIYHFIRADNPAHRVMEKFDSHFRIPGDETKPELVALRASLPIVVEVEV